MCVPEVQKNLLYKESCLKYSFQICSDAWLISDDDDDDLFGFEYDKNNFTPQQNNKLLTPGCLNQFKDVDIINNLSVVNNGQDDDDDDGGWESGDDKSHDTPCKC